MNKYEKLKYSNSEIWVRITDNVVPNILPYYYISNFGRIGSMFTGSFKLLSLVKDRDGYLNVTLHLSEYRNNNCMRNQIIKRVNRLVIMSFNPLPLEYENLMVNHINSIRDDNRLNNLEWVTSKGNVIHGIKYGNRKIPDIRGSKNPMAKLTENDVYDIAKVIKSKKYTYSEIAKMFNISATTVYNIANNKLWAHLNLFNN